MRTSRCWLGWVSLFVLGAGLGATAWADLTPKVYTGPDGGAWAEPGNWTPGGVPTNTHAVYLTNLTVKVDAEAVAGRLELVGAALIVGGPGRTCSSRLRSTPAGPTPSACGSRAIVCWRAIARSAA